MINSVFQARTVRGISQRVVDGPFGTQLKVEDYRDRGVPVIRVSNVRTGEISEEDLVRISPEKHQELIRSRVLPNDVVLTKAGAILGYAAVFPAHLREGNITSHSVVITCKPEISPSFLKYIFQSSIGQRQIYRWGNKSTRPELNTQEVKKILIPLPPRDIQLQVVRLMDEALKQKKKKEAEAQVLLASIDDYMLAELGIQIPNTKPNTLATRIIRTNFKTVSGNRFDSNPYHSTRIESIENLKRGTYETLPLRNLVAFSRNFAIGSATGLPYIGLENIESNTGRYLPAEIEEKDFSTASHFAAGSVLFPRLRPYLNKVFYAPFAGVCSTEFYVLSSPAVDAKYLSHFLRLRLVVNQTSYLMTGNTLPRLQTIEVKELLVSVPPPAIQSRIVARVENIRREANVLRFSAAQKVEQANQEIERIILGEQA